ncbi:MAG: gas vesicle protein K [Actinomycetes bacterium]
MIDVDQDDLRSGLLGLVFALVEIVQEVLAHTALQRVERGSLTDEEVERLGNAMADIEEAIAELKEELDVTDATKEIRDQLDDLVNDLVTSLVATKGVTDGPNGQAFRVGAG